MTGFVLRVELTLHYHLGGNSGVVGAGLPKGVVTAHTLIADQRIHDGVLKGVPHMQASGDIGRRDHNTVGVFATLGGEVTRLFPCLVPALFYGVGIVGLIHVGLRQDIKALL